MSKIDRRPKPAPVRKPELVTCDICGTPVTNGKPVILWVCAICRRPDSDTPSHLTRCIHCDGPLDDTWDLLSAKFAVKGCPECRTHWPAGGVPVPENDIAGLERQLPGLWEIRAEVARIEARELGRLRDTRLLDELMHSDDPEYWVPQ